MGGNILDAKLQWFNQDFGFISINTFSVITHLNITYSHTDLRYIYIHFTAPLVTDINLGLIVVRQHVQHARHEQYIHQIVDYRNLSYFTADRCVHIDATANTASIRCPNVRCICLFACY